ncbi:MAG: hypothetical protein AAF828_06020 [Bacteroidota bacterium]
MKKSTFGNPFSGNAFVLPLFLLLLLCSFANATSVQTCNCNDYVYANDVDLKRG